VIALAENLAQLARPMSQRDDKGEEKRDEAEEERDEKGRDEAEESDDEDEEEEEEEEEERPAAKPQRRAAAAAAARKPVVAAGKPSASGLNPTRIGVLVALAIAAGGAGGWFGHIAQAKAHVQKIDSAAAPAGSGLAGPCGTFQEKVCAGSGEQSAACQQAKTAGELLTPSTCEAGLNAIPATLARVKAARASCDTLVKKLCADLPQGSSTCAMVKEKTPSFPPKRCDEMLKRYDDVIGELRSMDQQGGPPGMGGPGAQGMPPGAPRMPPGMPPGMPKAH
jgi:hypothetical protein